MFARRVHQTGLWLQRFCVSLAILSAGVVWADHSCADDSSGSCAPQANTPCVPETAASCVPKAEEPCVPPSDQACGVAGQTCDECGTEGTCNSCVARSPKFEPPRITNSVWDIATGLPIAYKTKVLFTPRLMRPSFSDQPLDTLKGLACQIKTQQVDIPNRVKAAEFLSKVDCVAYPEAQVQLVEALQSDPCEKVRFAAAKALKKQFSHGKDKTPSVKESRRFDQYRGCCPNPDVVNILTLIASGTDETGCSIEASRRVRRAVSEALAECGSCAHCQGLHNGACGQSCADTGCVDAQPVPVSTDQEHGKQEKTDEQDHSAPNVAPAPPATKPETTFPKAAPKAKAPKAAATEQEPAEKRHEKTMIRPVSLEKKPKKSVEPLAEVECLRGYCPVALLEHKLILGDRTFEATFEGHTYYLSSAEAKEKFENNPKKYAPFLGGIDMLLFRRDGKKVPGSFFAIVDGQPYWFATKENRAKFKELH